MWEFLKTWDALGEVPMHKLWRDMGAPQSGTPFWVSWMGLMGANFGMGIRV